MRPLVPILLSYTAGILCTRHIELPAYAFFALLAISIAFPLALYFSRRAYRPIYIIPCFFILGIIAINSRTRHELPREHILNFINDKAAQAQPGAKADLTNDYEDIKGVVATNPEEPGNRTRLEIDAAWIARDGLWRRTTGRIRLTIQGRVDARPDDLVRVMAKLYLPDNFGNPGEYDYKTRLNMAGVYVTGFVKRPEHFIVIERSESSIQTMLGYARSSIRRFIDENSKEHGVLNSLVIADQGGVPIKTREDYAKTGTAHILSISGLHITIVASFFFAITLFLLKRSERALLAFNAKKVGVVVALVFVLLYGLLADYPVATQRSVLMALVLAVVFLIGRGYDIYNTVSLAALAILVWSPNALWDISFQLTFAAVISIVYMIPRFNELIDVAPDDANISRVEKQGFARRFFKKNILPALLVTISASVGTAPILAYHFHRIAVSGLAANLIAVPISGLITPAVLIAAITSFAHKGTASLVLYPADLLTQAMNWIISFFASLPFSSVWISTPTILEAALFYAIVFCALNIKKHKYYAYASIILILIVPVDYAYWRLIPRNSNNLTITYLSVGQGESEFVELPNNTTMLIDGGGLYSEDFDVGQRIIAPFLWEKKIHKIDSLVLTHAQRDHMAGLRFIAGNFEIGEFIWNGEGDLGSLGVILRTRKVPIRVVHAGDKLDSNDVVMDILNPPAKSKLDPNDGSVVLRLKHKNVVFLLTGDISAAGERELLKYFPSEQRPATTILKAPHHGSRGSSSSQFLHAILPEVVVISVGRGNVFGFPHQETLERYEAVNAKVYRTDHSGAVSITSNGDKFFATTYKNR